MARLVWKAPDGPVEGRAGPRLRQGHPRAEDK